MLSQLWYRSELIAFYLLKRVSGDLHYIISTVQSQVLILLTSGWFSILRVTCFCFYCVHSVRC